MSHLLILDIIVLLFGVISLLRAVRFLGHPPLRNRMIDYALVVSMLIVYPGQRFTESTTYDSVMEGIFVAPMIILVITGGLMLVFAMISAYISLWKPSNKR
ncbi:MAG: hypothetical protein HOM11_17825 [Methylococcales bacterium]|jgi:hypothetical protein|nr:hypothetical protein [Methylococcales bacterium]MBT7442576.1 hypothetical protein [Methylococcales bacterium]